MQTINPKQLRINLFFCFFFIEIHTLHCNKLQVRHRAKQLFKGFHGRMFLYVTKGQMPLLIMNLLMEQLTASSFSINVGFLISFPSI